MSARIKGTMALKSIGETSDLRAGPRRKGKAVDDVQIKYVRGCSDDSPTSTYACEQPELEEKDRELHLKAMPGDL